MTQPRGAITKGILTILAHKRYGATAPLVERQLEDMGIDISGKDSVAVRLCMLVTRGLVYRDGNHQCECCGSSKAVYRITEQGRIALGGVTQSVLEEV